MNYSEFSPVSNQLPKPTFSQISSPPLPCHTHVKIAIFSSIFLSKSPHCLALSFKPSKDSSFYYHFKGLEQLCFLISFQLLFFFLMPVIICHALLILQNGAGGLKKKESLLDGWAFFFLVIAPSRMSTYFCFVLLERISEISCRTEK